MPLGKYFFIRSEMNGLVLDIEGGSHDPGASVITWPQKDDDFTNQLWCIDHVTKSIRSKVHGLCLDVDEDRNAIIVSEYDSDKETQRWELSGELIQNTGSDRVLDIAGSNGDPGARVCAWDQHGNPNQTWSYTHLEAEYFYIHSKMHGKVIDIKKRKAEAGGKAVMWEREDDVDSQLWYEDTHGQLANKLNDFVIDTSKGDKARLQPCEEGCEHQGWCLYEDRICLRCNTDQVLDIKAAAEKDGAKLLSYPWHGNDNQRWEIQMA